MSTTVTYIRTYLARAVIIVTCLAMLVSYFFVTPANVSAATTELSAWWADVALFTLFVGLITVFMRYGRSIISRAENWPFHLYCLAVIVLWIPIGYFIGPYSAAYLTVYTSTKITLHISMIGLMIFFCISAMYRTFRIKSMRTAVLAILAMMLIVLNAPWLTAPFPEVGNLAYWLLNNPQMAASRSMVICAGIGALMLGFRILLGLERGALRATGGG